MVVVVLVVVVVVDAVVVLLVVVLGSVAENEGTKEAATSTSSMEVAGFRTLRKAALETRCSLPWLRGSTVHTQ